MTTSELEPQTTAKPKTAAGKSTRQVQLHKLLTRKSGVTIAQLQKIFDWKPHAARAAISAQRKAGCVVARTVTDKGSVYRIVAWQGDQ